MSGQHRTFAASALALTLLRRRCGPGTGDGLAEPVGDVDNAVASPGSAEPDWPKGPGIGDLCRYSPGDCRARLPIGAKGANEMTIRRAILRRR